MKIVECGVCFGPLELVDLDGKGSPFWRHVIGLGIIMQRCWSCGHFESVPVPPLRCPRCGSKRRWVFDHAATPALVATTVIAAVGT